MKKRFLNVLLTIIALCSFACFCACTNDEPVSEPGLVLALDHSIVELEKMEEITLVATLDDVVTTSVEWSSTNQSVATVVNGTVSAVSEGSAIIIAKSGDLEARCLINITDKGLVPVITTNIGLEDMLCLTNGDSFKVEYQVTYNKKVLEDAVVTLTLTENSFATLTDGVVQATEVGNAGTLVISATWKGLTYNVYVEVIVVENATAQLSDLALLSLCTDERGGKTNHILTPTFVYYDKELTLSEYTIDFQYDEKVVSVNPTTLEVLAVGRGKTDIVATFKESNSGITFESVLPVLVNLYADDRTDAITIDTLYLTRENYHLDLFEIYSDKTQDQLSGVEIDLITDVTSDTTFNIPIENGNIDLKKLSSLEIEGTRKWKIESNKFSYIVSVPTAEVDPAKNLIGNYLPKDWDYTMELVYDANKVKAVFKDKTNGWVVDSAYVTIDVWKNNNYLAGRITMEMLSTAITTKDYIIGYYIYSSGCYQMSLSESVSISVPAVCQFELYSEQIVAPYAEFKGNFISSDNISFQLNEDKTVVASANGTSVNGSYILTPSAPLSGQINITLNSALSGKTSFQGEYSYNKGSAEFTITDNAIDKTLVREGSTDIYVKYANHKNAGWVPMRLFADGTFVFAYAWDKISFNTMGTYQLIPDADSVIGNEKGTVILDMVSAYNYRSHYEGRYYVDENGVYCLKFEPMTLLNKELIYKPMK